MVSLRVLGCKRDEYRRKYALGGQDIAEEDLLHILRLDLGDTVNGGCGSGQLR
jgi:hypothetical protein